MMTITFTAIEQHIPELIRNFEVCLRSGFSLPQSFEIVAKDLSNLAGQEAQRVFDELEAGTELETALNNWLERMPSRDLDLFIATIKVQREVGGNLADKFRLLRQVMEKRKGVLL
ncbi:MAG: type II secretion system F family protein [Anaerolineales bacterium]